MKSAIIPNSDIGDIPVKLSVILAHPSRTSFNHAIAHTAVSQLQKNGHEVIFHDLYEEKFDPLLLSEEIPKEAELTPEVERHCKETQLVGTAACHIERLDRQSVAAGCGIQISGGRQWRRHSCRAVESRNCDCLQYFEYPFET